MSINLMENDDAATVKATGRRMMGADHVADRLMAPNDAWHLSHYCVTLYIKKNTLSPLEILLILPTAEGKWKSVK